MKEIIYHVTATVAGRATFNAEAGITQNQVLGVINKTTGKVIYTPLKYSKMSMSQSTPLSDDSRNYTLYFGSLLPPVAVGDNLLIKIYSDEDGYAKDATVAKEAQATLNKQEILARIGKSFAVAEDNVLKLHMVTLKQIESLWVKTSAGDVHFSITTDQSNYYLAFSSDSPQAIAGQAIEDDAVSMYNNDVIFPETVITFPSGWTITGVIIDGIDGNLLNEGDAWRLAELRRVISQIDMTAAQNVANWLGITEATEYQALTPAEAIAIARDCQYNVMGTDWPIPTWLPTGVTEAQVESAAEGLGIPYHEPTQTA